MFFGIEHAERSVCQQETQPGSGVYNIQNGGCSFTTGKQLAGSGIQDNTNITKGTVYGIGNRSIGADIFEGSEAAAIVDLIVGCLCVPKGSSFRQVDAQNIVEAGAQGYHIHQGIGTVRILQHAGKIELAVIGEISAIKEVKVQIQGAEGFFFQRKENGLIAGGIIIAHAQHILTIGTAAYNVAEIVNAIRHGNRTLDSTGFAMDQKKVVAADGNDKLGVLDSHDSTEEITKIIRKQVPNLLAGFPTPAGKFVGVCKEDLTV